MRFIETLREGERISGIYFCKHKTIAVAKSGKEYGNVILQDKTGTLDGKIWDLGSAGIREFESMDYVDIKGDVTVFNGALQLNIKEARKADEGTYTESDYMPTSQKDIEEMYAELTSIILSMKNEYLLKLTRRFFIDDFYGNDAKLIAENYYEVLKMDKHYISMRYHWDKNTIYDMTSQSRR